MFLAAKLRVWLLAFSLAAGWIVPSCQVVFQDWFLNKIWMITWRNSFARKPPNLFGQQTPKFQFCLATNQFFDFVWWPTKIFEIGRWATILEILVGGQQKFLKLVGEQPFLKFWSVANHNFWNWLVSNNFSNFGRWPTKFFENGWWPTNLFFYFFCPKSELCTLIFAKIEAVHTYFQLFLNMCTLILANLQVCTLIKLNLVGGQPKFLKLVGEQPFSKFWSVANHNFWNWLVSNHFSNFGRWPTKFFKFWLVANHFFEIGRWAAIFENLVRGQPEFLKLVCDFVARVFVSKKDDSAKTILANLSLNIVRISWKFVSIQET